MKYFIIVLVVAIIGVGGIFVISNNSQTINVHFFINIKKTAIIRLI